jgi:hypothetical protein
MSIAAGIALIVLGAILTASSNSSSRTTPGRQLSGLDAGSPGWPLAAGG